MALTIEAVEELGALHGEPEWLRARRREAFAAFERLPLPSRSDEEWRRTDVRGLDLDAFEPFERADGAAPGVPIEDTAGVLRQRGSEPGRVELDPEVARQSVLFMPLSQAAVEHPDLVRRHLFAEVRPDRDKFAALHAALFSGGTFLYVPDGVTISKPLVSQFWSSGGGAAVLPHTLVVAGRGSSFNYLDEFLSPDLDRPALTSGTAEVFAGEGAIVGYVALQRWGRHAWQFADQRIRAERDSTVRVVAVGLGGRFAKNRIEASLVGPGATAELKALYLGSGRQFFDFHTLQQHRVGNTTSDLLFKGALQDEARSVYAGLIRIEPGAARSDAYQANRNLLLSKTAKAHSIPMLEILNNDVRCTHGATVAPVDPEHLFYLQSRGIPGSTAERMIVHGFFGEVLDRIPVQQARDLVEQELETRIG
ncbi:MAG TPA: Fe-S cluster assembly protein SufD [Candidatus Dormibacteraeota bacterium]|nr:Fe-S cluster assembly protein SufD [Candidatus Dormibacteraeota bacterium]